MLVRPAGESNFEVFMVRRSEASHFVPNAYVFPGGTVDESDMSKQAFTRARGIDEPSLAAQFRAERSPLSPSPVGPPDAREAAGVLIAAVRELFEEAGVLLACDAAGNALDVRVDERLSDFPAMLERLDVYANTAALALFSHWITPPTLPRRYSAHFFVALASADQAAAADAIETHDGLWIEPRRALQMRRAGEMGMVFPTIKHVERLATFDTAEAVLRFARTKTIYSVMPETEADDFSLPPELEYAW